MSKSTIWSALTQQDEGKVSERSENNREDRSVWFGGGGGGCV